MSNRPTLLQAGSLIPNKGAKNAAELRKMVPIDYIKEKARDMMRNVPPKLFWDRVLIVQSLTGSGKSTIMATALYLELCAPSRSRMVVTEPRVLNAVSIPRDQIVPFFPQMKLGENLGWSTGKQKFRSRGLTYMTIGTFVETISVMSDDDFIDRYRVVMVDEVHEMTVELACMISTLKGLYLRNPHKNLPLLVFTSATFDFIKYLDYFDINDSAGGQPNLIQVEGKSFGRKDHLGEIEHGVTNYLESAAETVLKISSMHADDAPNRADVLIFLPGKGEILQLRELLSAKNSVQYPYKVLVLDREAQLLNTKDYKELMIPADQITVDIGGQEVKPHRKIILSTNVAETGVTIDTLKYVIDPGYHKAREYNPAYDIYVFITRPASKFRLTQRKGRIGRKFDGEYFPLFPQYIYDALQDKSLGEVVMTDLSAYLLSILADQVPKLKEPLPPGAGAVPIMHRLTITYPHVEHIDLIDTPPADSLRSCYEKLFALGMISISNDGYILTRLGALCAQFRGVAIESLRMVLAGYYLEYSIADLITIAAYLYTISDSGLPRNINWTKIYIDAFQSYMFENLSNTKLAVNKARMLVADGFIEGIIVYQAFARRLEPTSAEEIVSTMHKWCEDAGIEIGFLRTFIENRDRFIERFIIAGVNPFAYHERSFIFADQYEFINIVTRLKYCIYDGYRLNLMTLHDDNQYRNRNGIVIRVPKFLEDNKDVSSEPPKKPKHMVYYAPTLKYTMKSKRFETKPTAVSVLDGYVQMDEKFES